MRPKDDELALLKRLQAGETLLDAVDDIGMNDNRAAYLLKKWKESGIVQETGALTRKGRSSYLRFSERKQSIRESDIRPTREEISANVSGQTQTKLDS